MKEYNKLVRDKIPEIIKGDGDCNCEIRILEDNEYLNELKKKLVEEMNEFLESENVEELADLEEVLRAILDVKQVTFEEFENIRIKKVEKRGAFREKIFLIRADEGKEE